MLMVIYFALLGLVVGSAINAVVWRLYVGRSWAKGRSECPECHHRLAARDLVPVASWLALRGRCRYCRAKIHWMYPVVEVVTAGVFGLSAWALAPVTAGGWLIFGLWLVILTFLVILAVYDARWMLLPDKIMRPLIVAALVLVAARVAEYPAFATARGPMLAALVGGAAFYGLAAATGGRAMGGGDIKLVFAMGLLLGLKGLAVALLVAFNTAAVVGVTLIVTGRKRRRDHIPFGPFLVAGTIVAFLWGQDIVTWYLRINGLV